MPDYGTVYRDVQGRIMSIVNSQNASAPVPACPGWTVKDLVSHLAGVLDDVAKGRVEGAGSDEWTARHVSDRADKSVSEIMAEWHLQANTVPQVFNNPAIPVVVVDLVTHEHDLRAAIGQPGYRTHRLVKSSTRKYLSGLNAYFREEHIPALRLCLGDDEIVIGEGEPQGTLQASWFEIFRTISGRRTPDQVRNLTWDGDPERWIDHLFVLGPATSDQIE